MAAMRLLRRIVGSAWADAILALALLCLGQYEVWARVLYQGGAVFPGPRVANALAVVPLLTLPLAWRRRAPLISFAVVFATVALASAIFGGAEATTEFVAVLVSLYSATANSRRRYAVLGGAFVGGAVHELRDSHVHGAGDVIWSAGLLTVAWLLGVAVRGRHREIGDLTEETVRLAAEQDKKARLAVDEERARVARELHDIVAHAVSVIVVQSQAGQRLIGRDDERARESLSAIETTARSALTEMRRLLGMLRNVDVDSLGPQPGLGSLEALLGQVREAGLPVAFEIAGAPVALGPGLDLSAYRVVQEGLTNALKHAGAAEVHVRLTYNEERLLIEIADDGASATTSQSGHGLAGMRERVALYGGRLESGPRPDGGWLLRASLPLEV
jgi:signal transduction histidine kinase